MKRKLLFSFITIILFSISLLLIDFILTKSKIVPNPPNPSLAFFATSQYLPITLPNNLSFHQIGLDNEFNVTYVTNKFGYRGKFPNQISKPKNTKRVLFLGDSFTLGWGVGEDESFVGIITDFLKPKYEVINAAYKAGYSPDAYYAYLKKEGLELDPNLIVVVIYAGNDIIDIQDNIWIKNDEYNLPVKIRTYRNYTNNKGEYIKRHYGDPKSLYWRSSIIRLLKTTYNKFIYEKNIKKRSDSKSLADFKHLIQGTDKLAKDHNADVLYAIIPYSVNRPANELPHKYYDQILNIIQNTSENKVIPLKPYLTKNDFYISDGHLNKTGHHKVSKIILSNLQKYYLENQSNS